MPAQVRGVPGHDYDVSRPDGDFVLAARAQVGLAGLGWVDAPDVEAEWFAGGGEVGDLLQLFQFERRPGRATPAGTAPWGGTSHA